MTSDLVYLRFHGPELLYASNYTDDALREWAERIKAWRAEGRDVFAYFSNDEQGFNGEIRSSAAGACRRITVAHETPDAFAVVWSVPPHDASVAPISSGGRPMSTLLRIIEAAARDARRAEALMYEARSRRALRIDPEGALLAFELRAGAISDEMGEREARIARRDHGARAARRNTVLV